LIGDPLHVRAVKRHGATTREAAFRISAIQHHDPWLDPTFQAEVTAHIDAVAQASGHSFTTGPRGFSILAS
jgi:hypothetical protein